MADCSEGWSNARDSTVCALSRTKNAGPTSLHGPLKAAIVKYFWNSTAYRSFSQEDNPQANYVLDQPLVHRLSCNRHHLLIQRHFNERYFSVTRKVYAFELSLENSVGLYKFFVDDREVPSTLLLLLLLLLVLCLLGRFKCLKSPLLSLLGFFFQLPLSFHHHPLQHYFICLGLPLNFF